MVAYLVVRQSMGFLKVGTLIPISACVVPNANFGEGGITVFFDDDKLGFVFRNAYVWVSSTLRRPVHRTIFYVRFLAWK